MPRGYLSPVMQFLRSITGASADGDAHDDALLRRFANARDEAAFADLVRRHGPMVLGVCERVLGNMHDAEDAFQATFFVLARKAAGGFRPRLLGLWLHGVAVRTALKARTALARRRAKERAAAVPAVEQTQEPGWSDLRPVLDEEIGRLPANYRRPFILCYLEGLTNEAAAEQIGCPKGTILSRLAWARERLRSRLIRRGLASAAALVGTELSHNMLTAGVSPALAACTARAATAFAWSAGPVAGVSGSVLALTQGVLHAMIMHKVRIAAAFVLVVGFVVAGAGVLMHEPRAAATQEPPAQKTDGAQKLKELRSKRLEAVRKEYDALAKAFFAGQITGNYVFDAAARLVQADLDTCEGRAARIAACQSHLSRMQEVEAVLEAKYRAGKIGIAERAPGEFYRLDAEIRLEQEKLK